jgi:hypothetical protein
MSAISFWDGTKWVTLNTTGATGAQGPRGDKGDAGAPGVDGRDGADGAPGVDGRDGADGKDGSGVTIKGTANAYPPDATPTVGDMWLVADPVPGGFPPGTNPGEGLVWDGTSWVNVGSIRGPKGEVGADGADGAPGADGAAGADGQGFKVRGEWVAGPDYDNYDVVTYNGASYVQIATPSGTGVTPDAEPESWQLLASGGADGAEGPRGPNAYVQTAEPVGGGVGELWIDPDAVAAVSEPCLPLKGGTMSGSVVFDTTRQTAGDNKEIACRGGGVAGSPSSYWGLEVNPDDNTGITYCVGVLIGKKTSNEAAGLSGYGIVSDIDGPSSYAIWARGTAPSRFAGSVQMAGDLAVTGSVSVSKGGISGEAVGFATLYEVTDQNYTLQYDPSPAGRRDRRILFSSTASNRITVPTNAAAFPLGWEVLIYNTTVAGAVNRCEVVAAAGVQVNWGDDTTSHNTTIGDRLQVRNNYGLVRLVKVNTATWLAFGDTIKI